MPRALVVYYSRTGTTARAAERIAEALHADLEAIADPTPRLGVRGYLRCAYQAVRKTELDLPAPARDPGAYDLVVVGGPVWFGAPSSPVRSWLRRHAPRLPAVALFCTCGGHRGEDALSEMERVCGKAPSARLVLTDRDRREGRVDAKVSRFEQEARQALGKPTS